MCADISFRFQLLHFCLILLGLSLHLCYEEHLLSLCFDFLIENVSCIIVDSHVNFIVFSSYCAMK